MKRIELEMKRHKKLGESRTVDMKRQKNLGEARAVDLKRLKSRLRDESS